MPQRREVDVLIVGAGLAGLLLARALRARGLRAAVAHDAASPGASEAAVGLLNPVRGQRCTLAWRAAETWDAARSVYAEVARTTGTTVLRPVTLVRAFATADEFEAFGRRAATIAAAGFAARPLAAPPAGMRDAGHGIVAIDGGGALDARRLLTVLRAEARAAGALIERRCSTAALVDDTMHVRWPALDLAAPRVVLAGGIDDLLSPSPAGPPPLRPVRGESLLIRAPGLDEDSALVCGHHLAPVGHGLWACGGTKVPGDIAREPTTAGRAELEAFLTRHLTVAWKVVAHACGVRATTPDTRPVVGPLVGRPRVLSFNGFGSQGYAVIPWLAQQFADHLAHGTPLPPDVDPARFAPPAAGAGGRWHAVDEARAITTSVLAPGDRAIDLTAGNGGDTHTLALAVGSEGTVLAIDIQPAAIEATRRRLEREGCDTPVELRCADHAILARLVPASWHGRVGAVVANLGYLPGSDSPVITQPASTLAAFAAALDLLRPGGALVAVIYTQHAGGADELAAIERWAAALDPVCFRVAWGRAPDRSPRAPVVFSATRVGSRVALR